MTHVQNFATLRTLWTLLPPVDIAVLFFIYNKHNLYRQSKLGGDVELKNTHNVLFKSPGDVHQVGTLSVQLGLGSTLVDWYGETSSVPFGRLLIALLRFQTFTYATERIAVIFHQSFMLREI